MGINWWYYTKFYIKEKLSFKYRFKWSFNLVDENECLMKIENGKINVSIVFQGEGNKVKYQLKLEIKQINYYEVILEPNSRIIEDLIYIGTKFKKVNSILCFICNWIFFLFY